jgi:monodechloroaminopyrrolnitrin synthase
MNRLNSFHLLDQCIRNNDITTLDPLGFDQKISVLHELNRKGDTKEMIQLLYRCLPMPDQLDRYSYDESIAVMRDLGIFIGILKKNGIEPVAVVPELEYVLLVLMVKTDLPPRDTLLHYTVWNPDGERMRTYTNLPDEKALVESVKIALPSLMECIFMLEELHDYEALSGASFEQFCVAIRRKLEDMVKGVVHAKRNVSREVFSNELRFYYDPIKVDYNKDYIGPGAVEMPMFVVDHLLWSCDVSDETYTKFKEGYLPYNLHLIRNVYRKFDGRASLLTRVEDNLTRNTTSENVRAAQVVLELCNVLKSFRMPHKKMAEEAYAHGDENHRDKGSGGYSTDILSHIIALQNLKIASLQTSLSYSKFKVDS